MKDKVNKRKLAEEIVLQGHKLQSVLNKMLSISMKPLSLEEMLNRILDQIVSIPWLTLESRGAIFLVEDKPDELVMKSHKKLPAELQNKCSQVPFGKCLCGRAAATGKLVFADCLDDRHEVQYKNISPHGHYCIPIQSSARVLGVLYLYVRENHKRNKDEEEFLLAIANGLAGIIERKYVEEELIKYRQQLEELVKERTAKLTAANEQLRQEITERRRAEEAQRKSEARWRSLVENAPDIIFTVNRKGEILFINHAPTGLTVEDTLGTSAYDYVAPEYRKVVKQSIQRVFRTGDPDQFEIVARGHHGNSSWSSTCLGPIKHNDKVIAVLLLTRDITKSKQSEEALKTSEKRFRTIFENASDGIIATEPDTKKFVIFNKRMCKLTGYSEKELSKLSITDIHPPKDLSYALDQFNKLVTGEITVARDVPVLKKNKKIIYCDISASFSNFEGQELLVGFFRDITEQKQAEEQVEKSWHKLQRVFEETVEALALATEKRDPYTAGHQQRVAQLASAIAEELGLPQEKIEGIRIAGILHDIGKIHMPTEILNKPGRLTEMEFGFIKTHPQVGYEILKGIEFDCQVAQTVLHHHERLNGTGYPEGISGKKISLQAKIIAVADVVEAMCFHRPYRPALKIDIVLKEISDNSGKLYDSNVVGACLRLLTEKGFGFG